MSQRLLVLVVLLGAAAVGFSMTSSVVVATANDASPSTTVAEDGPDGPSEPAGGQRSLESPPLESADEIFERGTARVVAATAELELSVSKVPEVGWCLQLADPDGSSFTCASEDAVQAGRLTMTVWRAGDGTVIVGRAPDGTTDVTVDGEPTKVNDGAWLLELDGDPSEIRYVDEVGRATVVELCCDT